MGSDRSRSIRRAGRGLLWGLAAGHLVEALALRRRREAVISLAGTGGPPPGAGTARAAPTDRWTPTLVTVAGAAVEPATRAAVQRLMDERELDVVDLVPGDLPPDRWIRVLRRLDATAVGRDPLRAPGGANEALALRPATATRMDVTGADGGDVAVDRGTLARRTVQAQRHAPTRHGLRLAPGLRAGHLGGDERWRELEAITDVAWPYAAWAPVITAIETAHLLAMTAGLLLSPGGALAALATWAAQPALILAPVGDEPAPPPGALAAAGVARLPRAWAANLATIAAGRRATRARAARRAATPLPPALTPTEQYEPRRDTCPWCGSAALHGRLDVPDLLLHKPGEYHLDECGGCGHIFQNPALTTAGLDYIYEDAYDGTGAELAEVSLAWIGDNYRSRVASLERFTRPRAVLDVGTGHAHFLVVARQAWPDATLDALDMGPSVEEAHRRGWVDTAHRGRFLDLAGSLPRSYDVVTMHHYLEHTRDPRAEIDAVAKVLEPGGHLMVELPDAEHAWARILGRYWYGWGQPQHQHFIPCRNLVAAFEEAGFEVLSVQRGPVTLGGDCFNGMGLLLQHLARSPHLPWLPDPGWTHRLKRIALCTAALPAVAASRVVDAVKDARLDDDTPSNAYRIVARRL